MAALWRSLCVAPKVWPLDFPAATPCSRALALGGNSEKSVPLVPIPCNTHYMEYVSEFVPCTGILFAWVSRCRASSAAVRTSGMPRISVGQLLHVQYTNTLRYHTPYTIVEEHDYTHQRRPTSPCTVHFSMNNTLRFHTPYTIFRGTLLNANESGTVL